MFGSCCCWRLSIDRRRNYCQLYCQSLEKHESRSNVVNGIGVGVPLFLVASMWTRFCRKTWIQMVPAIVGRENEMCEMDTANTWAIELTRSFGYCERCIRHVFGILINFDALACLFIEIILINATNRQADRQFALNYWKYGNPECKQRFLGNEHWIENEMCFDRMHCTSLDLFGVD